MKQVQRGISYALIMLQWVPSDKNRCLNNGAVTELRCSCGMILCCYTGQASVCTMFKHLQRPVCLWVSGRLSSSSILRPRSRKLMFVHRKSEKVRLCVSVLLRSDMRAPLSSWCPGPSSGQVPSGSICPWPHRNELCTAPERPQWASSLNDMTQHNTTNTQTHHNIRRQETADFRAIE